MENTKDTKVNLPEDLKKCVDFHGHLCPGLVYGYLIAREAMDLLKLERSKDEEVVAVSENDSCAVDALQVLLGTSTGKGNLIIKEYGKNAYTIFNRSSKKAYRFSRYKSYQYSGESKMEFARLDEAISSGKANEEEKWHHKHMKSADLLSRPFDEIFSAKEVDFLVPPFAPLARSEACSKCGEMTMSTKMVDTENGIRLCIPCSI
jgi:formylmethanofuran dehydrogenase subunit E